MNPYLAAFEKYQAQQPDIPWTDALDFHLQHGTVISDESIFVMARPVDPDRPYDHAKLIRSEDPQSQTWHVWMVAGSLENMLIRTRQRGIRTLTFMRRDGLLRTYSVRDLWYRSRFHTC